MRRVALRGWNGTLRLTDSAVEIRRGLRGILIRKRRDADLSVPFDQIAVVRYAPARGVGGYVQIVKRGSPAPSIDYLSTIRDARTVTFATRSGRWRLAAQEIVDRSGGSLELSSAAPYWSAVFGSVSSKRRA
jgi:hypothetical protein